MPADGALPSQLPSLAYLHLDFIKRWKSTDYAQFCKSWEAPVEGSQTGGSGTVPFIKLPAIRVQLSLDKSLCGSTSASLLPNFLQAISHGETLSLLLHFREWLARGPAAAVNRALGQLSAVEARKAADSARLKFADASWSSAVHQQYEEEEALVLATLQSELDSMRDQGRSAYETFLRGVRDKKLMDGSVLESMEFIESLGIPSREIHSYVNQAEQPESITVKSAVQHLLQQGIKQAKAAEHTAGEGNHLMHSSM